LVRVDEQRFQRQSSDDTSDEIGDTSGFAGLALVFHPAKRQDFEMTCEGLGRWHEQAAWLVHFKEREDRPDAFQLFFVGGQKFPLRLKGRAWITADNFQIVRIESELVSPVPAIQLVSEQQVVEYGPVPFPKKIWSCGFRRARKSISTITSTTITQTQLRSLPAVFSGFGGKAERAQSAAVPSHRIGGWPRPTAACGLSPNLHNPAFALFR